MDGQTKKHEITLRLRWVLGECLALGRDHREGWAMLDDTWRRAKRVFGPSHEITRGVGRSLYDALPLPRFKVGARVECRMDDVKYYKGTVLRHHYSEEGWDEELKEGSILYQRHW